MLKGNSNQEREIERENSAASNPNPKAYSAPLSAGLITRRWRNGSPHHLEVHDDALSRNLKKVSPQQLGLRDVGFRNAPDLLVDNIQLSKERSWGNALSRKSRGLPDHLMLPLLYKPRPKLVKDNQFYCASAFAKPVNGRGGIEVQTDATNGEKEVLICIGIDEKIESSSSVSLQSFFIRSLGESARVKKSGGQS